MSNIYIGTTHEDDEFDDMIPADPGITNAPNNPVPTGPIGQQIGKQIQNGGVTSSTPVPTASGGVGASPNNWPFNQNAPVAGGSVGVVTTGTIAQSQKQFMWSNLIIGGQKAVSKTKMRYVVIKKDGSTLELKEQSNITPEEMIGITKFIGMVTTYTVLILGEAIIEYNFKLSWSDMIMSLGISKHFAPGLAPDDYDVDGSDVLDILLYDPQ